jgi:hypothetical protein
MQVLVWFHRWVGVVLSAMFAVWFFSGGVMSFVPFPVLTAADRTAQSEPIDLSRLHVAPAEASRLMGLKSGLRLVSVGGVPVYVGRGLDGRDSAWSGETGEPVSPVTVAQAGEIASRFGSAPAVRADGPIDYDQWIINDRFDPLRPFYRVRLSDGLRTELYVSARSGEVAHRTRGFERGWNWVGTVLHWVYFVPFRKNFHAWDRSMWFLGLIAVMTTVAGVSLGLIRTTKTLRSKRPAVSPFRGFLRWHHILGLMAGLFVLGWIVSGWFTNDDGTLFSDGSATAAQIRAYEGVSDRADAATISIADLHRLTPASTIAFRTVAGRAIAAAGGSGPARVAVAGFTGAAIYPRLPAELLAEAVQRTWPKAESSRVSTASPDSVYAKAEHLQGDTVQVDLSGSAERRVFIDAVSGDISAVLNGSREVYDWVCYAVHTFNYPGLSSRPALRRSILLVPLTLGFCFSLTGVVIGIRRLRTTLK